MAVHMQVARRLVGAYGGGSIALRSMWQWWGAFCTGLKQQQPVVSVKAGDGELCRGGVLFHTGCCQAG